MAELKKSTHKNAARSRFMIKKAFAQLLNEKDLHKITVTDIVERANISRGTFYAHYLDVYDLSVAIQNNVIETIDKVVAEKGIAFLLYNPSDVIVEGMKFLESNKNYFKLFVTSYFSETLISRIVNRLNEEFLHEISDCFSSTELADVKMFIAYSLGAFEKVIIQWFYDDIDLPAAQCAEFLSRFYLNSKPLAFEKLLTHTHHADPEDEFDDEQEI